MATLVSALLLVGLVVLMLGSLLSLSSSAHWFIRSWDFPRVQIIVGSWLLCGGIGLACWAGNDTRSWLPRMALAITIGLSAWHGFRIFPYTLLSPKQAAATARHERNQNRASDIRVVISNVERENDQYELWMQVIREADPDVLIVLEPNQSWIDAIRPLTDRFSSRVILPQDNWYGMMMLSKLPMLKHEVRYLVQDDIPSIDAELRLEDGQVVRVVAVHPRPPEPIRGNDATARDAELTLWGTELGEETQATIIGGDLNDVAWSATSRLFLRTSKMLDPRRGRGMFNSFHARHLWMRYPLDHVFVSAHFTINDVRRLAYVGSDHFPILIDLRHSLAKPNEDNAISEKPGDEELIEEKIERAIEHPETKGEAIEGVDVCSECRST